MDINNIYFYLLLGVFFYFLFTYVLENYLVEQENFDPSLVPVSSIVTLAKVAQKLVNGNGTLTNPGNLQIGKDVGTPSGSLTVTGKTAIGSTTMGDKTLNVTGTLGVSGKAVINAAGVPSDITNYSDLTVGGSMGVVGNTTVGGSMGITGETTVGGTLNVDGATSLNKPLTIKSGDKWGNTLNLLQGTETTGAAGEPPYISFMQNDGTTRNGYIMGKPEGILLNAPSTDISGNATIDGKLILTNTKEGAGYITSGEGKTGLPGRLHISNGEDLFLLPKGTTHVSNAWGGTGNLNVSGDLNVGGKLTVTGTQLTIIKLGQLWEDRGFIEKMVPYFKKSDPDGTRIDFMLVHDNGSVRLQSGVKYGNVMLRVYQTSLNGGDIGTWGPNTTSATDPWRINLTQ